MSARAAGVRGATALRHWHGRRPTGAARTRLAAQGRRHAGTDAAAAWAPEEMPPFAIVDSTLREGEQFATAQFGHHDRVYIAKTLDQLGVDFIELVNPMASTQAAKDCEAVANLDLKAKVLTHVRCHMDDVRLAVNTGVDGVNVYMATSKILRQHSHGKGIEAIVESATEVISFVKDHGLEIRFSCEDTFRSDISEALSIYRAVNAIGVDRVGVADTVGIATPTRVHQVISAVREVIDADTGIEFHAHDDVGCSIANSLMALKAGATHIDTCVLGIGERNGITPLGGFLARMYTMNREEILSRYDLTFIKPLERYIAVSSGVSIPFNNCVTGTAAFTHKAGVHSKAVSSNPEAYEIIAPEHFGVKRSLQIASRLTGWNAMAARAQELGVQLSTVQIKKVTTLVKEYANTFKFDNSQIDEILKDVAQALLSMSPLQLDADANGGAQLKAAAEAAAAALDTYESARIKQIVLSIVAKPAEDSTPSKLFFVQGHLFDQQLLNNMCDAVVDSPCEFQVLKLDVGEKDELHSSAVLRIWSEEAIDLDGLQGVFQDLVAKSEGSVLQEASPAEAARLTDAITL